MKYLFALFIFPGVVIGLIVGFICVGYRAGKTMATRF